LAYQQIIDENLIDEMNMLYEDGWWLMQDNASCHTSRSTHDWLENMNIRVIDWPPNSPDLNPIENVWGMMKIIISHEEPIGMGPFKQIVRDVWAQIDHDKLESFLKSMPQRIEKVIAAKGLTIKH